MVFLIIVAKLKNNIGVPRLTYVISLNNKISKSHSRAREAAIEFRMHHAVSLSCMTKDKLSRGQYDTCNKIHCVDKRRKHQNDMLKLHERHNNRVCVAESAVGRLWYVN